MSRDFTEVDYYIHYVTCDQCGNKQRIKDSRGPMPDGWIETMWNYRNDMSNSVILRGATGLDFNEAGFRKVDFCCVEHMDAWFVTHPQGMVVKWQTITFGGATNG